MCIRDSSVEKDRQKIEVTIPAKGHVIRSEQVRIAEAAGACAVMALERIPADIRACLLYTSDHQVIQL